MQHIIRYSMLFLGSCLFSFLLQPVSAQESEDRTLPFDIWLEPDTDEFTEIQRQAEEYFKDKSQDRGSGYRHWKRWEFMMNGRLTVDGKITNYVARNFEAHRRYSKIEAERPQQRTYGGFWFPEATDGYILGNSGYNPGIGRVNVIAFHPTDASTIFAGTPAGGLWKTTNEGTSWTPLTDAIPRIGVSGIAIDPDNANIIYILTGDGDGGDTYTVGVLKTTNGGTTWNTTGLVFDPTNLDRGYKLAMKPGDNNTLFAVTTDGIYRTENSGTDWTLVRTGSFRDLEFQPGDPETIYACTSNVFHRSLNGGDTWSTISTGLPTGETRSALAVSNSVASYVYYLAGPGGPTGSFKGLYRSTNSGTSFSTIITSPNILDSSLSGNDNCNNGCDQAGYDLAIAVDPNDADEVITGGINVWRNEDIDLGNAWTIISHWNTNTQTMNSLEYTHADIHELVYQDNNRIWCGSDGGIFLSTDDGLTWTDKTSVGTNNGLVGTQFYRIAGTPQNSTLLIGGTQDNGSNRWTGGNDITHFDGADGMDCMLDFTNTAIQYHCRQNGGLRKSTNSGSTHSSINPSNSNGAWVTPVRMDPSNEDEIWAGYNDTLYRSTNAGSAWTAFIPSAGAGTYKYIWCAPSNSSVIYAATDNAIFRNASNGTGAWTNITGNLPVGTTNITGITTDLDNSNDVWVSLSGYDDGDKVYFTSTGTNPWTNVSGSLPNVPINCVIYDDAQVNDNAVYVGTDIGIFYRDAAFSDWVPFRNGLPTVPIFDMYVSLEGDKLYAGTYGRGLWSSNLYSACPGGWFLTDANAPGTYPEGNRYYQASDYIQSTRDILGGVGTEVYYKAGNYVQLNEGFRARSLDVFRSWIGPCSGGIPEMPLTDTLSDEESALRDTDFERDQYMLDYEPPEVALPETGNLHVSLSADRSSLVISTGNETRVDIVLMQNGITIQILDAQLLLQTGKNTIPLSLGALQKGEYHITIIREQERITVPLEVR
ncbi:MAG TPA: hypothetical protein VI603_05255 [Saprospiraceae bacterium]|nr:hypothetical protein [Saprospiraceae bacterium]